MGRRLGLGAGGAAIAALAAVAWVGWDRPVSASRGAPEPHTTADLATGSRGWSTAPGAGAVHSAATAASTAIRFAPESLAGTESDGELGVDEHGYLVVNEALRRFFDYHTSASGEVSEAAIDRAVRAAMAQRLPPQAAAQGGLLWDRYQRYRLAGRERLERGELEGGDLATRLEAVAALRRSIFGDAHAEALFGREEQVQRVDIARMQARADTALSPQEKAEAEAALEEDLPSDERAAREESALLSRLDAAEAQAGGDPGALHAARVATVGEPAAARLAELDAAREAWQARVDAFQSELGEGQDVQALLDRSFDEREQIRVRTLLGLAP